MTLDKEALRHAVAVFYDTLSGDGNQKDKMDWADKMFDFTARFDELAHVRSLVFRAVHPILNNLSCLTRHSIWRKNMAEKRK